MPSRAFSHLTCYTFACLPRSRFCLVTQQSPQRGRGSGGGRSVVDQTKTTVFELRLIICVLAEQIRSYSGQRLTHPSRLSQTSPSAARDVMGRRKTPCSRRVRCAKTTGDEPGSQVKRRTSHVTNPILRSEIYCCSSQV